MKTIYIRILMWITKKIVIQSHDHRQNIIDYFEILNDAARKEFVEDNKYSLDSFLDDCFQLSLKKVEQNKQIEV